MGGCCRHDDENLHRRESYADEEKQPVRKELAMPAIDTPELKSLMEREEDFLLVNTLPSESFESTKLPRAINIPQKQDDFIERTEDAAGNKDKKVVVYCANVDCNSSTEAAKKLDGTGFTNVYDYRGGAKAWRENVVEQASRSTGA
jgi:rhodanese-related sulfurtransferase